MSPSAIDAIAALRVIPVITVADAVVAEPLAAALKQGGLPIAEITLRTPAAMAAIGRMSQDPDMLVGAGTVTTQWQADEVKAAGARFLVSPGIRPDLLRHCLSLDLPVFPGVVTPSEVMAAIECGVQTLKFFPAASFGGLTTISALASPFPDVRFIPTGGIDDRSAVDYLAHPAVTAVGGSWMVPSAALAAEDFAAIAGAAALAVERCASPAPSGKAD